MDEKDANMLNTYCQTSYNNIKIYATSFLIKLFDIQNCIDFEQSGIFITYRLWYINIVSVVMH